MKQTAVEWLVSNISSNIDNEYFCNQKEITEWVDQAKEMEKEQIINSYDKGELYQGFNGDAEQYYNKTFKK